MSKCKDCFHYEACNKFNERLGIPTTVQVGADKYCGCYKNISDVVEVVRCKDCKHWGGITYGFVCRKFSGIDTKICMGADHYCSYGERSENGT